ncbi:TBC1 domain family member 13 [Liparis tanakae]|uniref:TBC1 domain family member 13 n=1 Tax=Liparis tanakae TaxID=230148 RepID=A0A4Z2G038_9TELE|nr:TBC1 domain family member 13 [Liparis tanakae]
MLWNQRDVSCTSHEAFTSQQQEHHEVGGRLELGDVLLPLSVHSLSHHLQQALHQAGLHQLELYHICQGEAGGDVEKRCYMCSGATGAAESKEQLWQLSVLQWAVESVSSPGKALHLYPSNEYEVLPNGSEAHWEVVERILFIYAKLNPGIAYVQGMNEVVGPIYYTFATDPNSQWKEHAEADTFFCFTNLMSENRDNFLKSLDDSQCGITYKMESVYSMLKDKDLDLYLKLETFSLLDQTRSVQHASAQIGQASANELTLTTRGQCLTFSSGSRRDEPLGS